MSLFCHFCDAICKLCMLKHVNPSSPLQRDLADSLLMWCSSCMKQLTDNGWNFQCMAHSCQPLSTLRWPCTIDRLLGSSYTVAQLLMHARNQTFSKLHLLRIYSGIKLHRNMFLNNIYSTYDRTGKKMCLYYNAWKKKKTETLLQAYVQNCMH